MHEELLQNHSLEIKGLEARADFKDVRIEEIKTEMEKIDKKIDKIDESLNQLKLQSERDDFNIDNRVTQLETTQNTLKWIIGIGLTCIGTAVTVLAFFLTIIH